MEEKTTMNPEAQHCAFCGAVIEGDNFGIVDGEIMCPECVERLQVTCTNCGCLITDGNYRLINDEDPICLDCVDNYCTTCERCGTLIYDEDVYPEPAQYASSGIGTGEKQRLDFTQSDGQCRDPEAGEERNACTFTG